MPLEANSPTVRAAIYARYSSDHQSEASIEDQVRICRALVGAHGWEVAQVYSDSAMSGASIFRPGYQKWATSSGRRSRPGSRASARARA
jgi:DNA invertase Pin-like site-specific DNA recombinase